MTAEGGGAVGGYLANRPQQLQQQLQVQRSPVGMALPPSSPVTAAAAVVAAHVGSSTEDPGKKVRKPYTITKSRESWTEQEHDKFLEALQLFDRDWKKIEAFVGSKTVIQIRSHAQKYFLKVQKNGTTAHVPPPRPKRKAAHPYPQKASKNAPLLSQAAPPFQASCLLESGYALKGDSSPVNSATGATVPSWSHSSVPLLSASNVTKDDEALSAESPSRTWLASDNNDQGNNISSLCVMPDFAQVYSFIGSVFDPNTGGHLQKLNEMDPINVETVLLLMRNLSVNLANPDLEDHRRLLSSYDIGTNERVSCAAKGSLIADDAANTPFMVKSES